MCFLFVFVFYSADLECKFKWLRCSVIKIIPAVLCTLRVLSTKSSGSAACLEACTPPACPLLASLPKGKAPWVAWPFQSLVMVCICTRLVWGWEGTGVNKALLGPRVARGPSNAVATLEQMWPFMTTRSHFYSCRGFSVLILMLSSHTPPHACPRIVGIKALCIQEYCNSLTVHICVHTCTLYPAGLHLQNTS